MKVLCKLFDPLVDGVLVEVKGSGRTSDLVTFQSLATSMVSLVTHPLYALLLHPGILSLLISGDAVAPKVGLDVPFPGLLQMLLLKTILLW